MSPWQRAHAGTTRPRAVEIDTELHSQRTIDLDAPARWSSPIDALPDGSMVEIDDELGLVLAGEVRRWGASGYGAAVRTGPNVTVVSPRATVATIRAGYTVDLHPSARQPECGIAPSD